ncbi:MAG: bifunctional diaminohydroxyphosphoribosylaminopyrimidine deaminase/5-amino-6-(5-phosphoribosylamino)uracil reductase RibD [Gemmatimonadaceae bacterium]
MTGTTRSSQDAPAFMRRALELAREGWGQTAPNPMVGAVVVRDGAVAGEGYHARFGEPHAEVMALGAAGDHARGATLYVTLEPCRHHGKTPPCTDAIVAAGVQRVVIAAPDPTADAGGGAALLRAAGIQVQAGLLEAEARELNAPFFHAVASDLPWTTLKLAVSIETAIANERGSTSWLTGADARGAVHALRAGHDAIAVGVGTVIADDPQLTVRDARPPRVPLRRVIFDRTLRTPLESAMVRTAAVTPTTIVTRTTSSVHAKALANAGVHLIAAPGLREAFRALRAEGVRALLVEGGAAIASAVLREKLAHRLVIFQAPVSLGEGALHAFDGAPPHVLSELERYPVLDRRMLGPDLMTTYALADR